MNLPYCQVALLYQVVLWGHDCMTAIAAVLCWHFYLRCRRVACISFSLAMLLRQNDNSRRVLKVSELLFAIRLLISQTANRRIVNSTLVVGPISVARKQCTRYFAYPSPNFHMRSKVRNLASIFDLSRLWSAVIGLYRTCKTCTGSVVHD